MVRAVQAADKDAAVVRALGAKPPGSHDRGGIGLSSPSQHAVQGPATYSMAQVSSSGIDRHLACWNFMHAGLQAILPGCRRLV